MPYTGTSRSGDCHPAGRLILDPPNGVEVPTVVNEDGDGGIETEIRKGGTADIQAVSEAHVPYVWDGEEITEVTDVLRGNVTTRARVDVLDDNAGVYTPVHEGFVRSIGASGTVSDCARLLIGDFCEVFQAVGANYQYENPTVQSVLEDMRDDAVSATNLLDELPIRSPQFDTSGNLATGPEQTTGGPAPMPLMIDPTPIWRKFGILPEKESINSVEDFRPNRHNLTDVLDWLCEQVSARWYISPRPAGEGPVLVFDTRETYPTMEAGGLDEQTDATVLKNNALYQLSPAWRLKAKGKTDKSLIGRMNDSTSRTKYPIATVQHTELAKRVGDPPHPEPPQIEPSTKTIKATEKAVMKAFKDRLDGAAGGEMILLPTPISRPFTSITATPTCQGTSIVDFEPIEYEIEEVVHELKPPTPASPEGPRTIVRCGLPVDDEKIEIVESGMVDVSGSNE